MFDSFKDKSLSEIIQISENNPKAKEAVCELLKTEYAVDYRVYHGELGSIDILGKNNIKGEAIADLYKECSEDIVGMHAVLKATELGIISADNLKRLISTKSKIDVADILNKVQKKIPEFGRTYGDKYESKFQVMADSNLTTLEKAQQASERVSDKLAPQKDIKEKSSNKDDVKIVPEEVMYIFENTWSKSH